MLFDTHAHYDSGAFNADRDAVLAALPAAGVTLVVNPGCDLESTRQAVALAERFPHVYAAVGIHPSDCGGCGETEFEELKALCRHEKVVAIGEIGLDYYNDEHSPHGLQQEFLIRQLDLARKTGLPVIIHDRDSHEDVLRIIREEGKGVRGVLHCFSGDWAMAEEALALGWYLGFWGTSTFKNDRGVRFILARVPEDRILFETDSPYMAPVPYRGKRNNPLYTAIVAERAAELRGTTPEKIMESSTNNAKKLFFRLTNQ